MSISLSYHLDDDDSIKTQEFILAGYYTDYSQVRTNDKGSIYVSEEFKNKAAISTGKVVMVSLKIQEIFKKECDRLKGQGEIFLQHRCFVNCTCNTSEQPSINYRHCLYTIIHIY